MTSADPDAACSCCWRYRTRGPSDERLCRGCWMRKGVAEFFIDDDDDDDDADDLAALTMVSAALQHTSAAGCKGHEVVIDRRWRRRRRGGEPRTFRGPCPISSTIPPRHPRMFRGNPPEEPEDTRAGVLHRQTRRQTRRAPPEPSPGGRLQHPLLHQLPDGRTPPVVGPRKDRTRRTAARRLFVVAAAFDRAFHGGRCWEEERATAAAAAKARRRPRRRALADGALRAVSTTKRAAPRGCLSVSRVPVQTSRTHWRR